MCFPTHFRFVFSIWPNSWTLLSLVLSNTYKNTNFRPNSHRHASHFLVTHCRCPCFSWPLKWLASAVILLSHHPALWTVVFGDENKYQIGKCRLQLQSTATYRDYLSRILLADEVAVEKQWTLLRVLVLLVKSVQLAVWLIVCFIITEKARAREWKWEGVGVVKGKVLKLEDVEAPHALGGASDTLRYINLAIEPEAGLGYETNEPVCMCERGAYIQTYIHTHIW